MAELAGRILGQEPGRTRKQRLVIAIERGIGVGEPDPAVRARRDAWKAAVLRRVNSTGWLPPELARNVCRIQPAEDGSRVDVWLFTGALITETCDWIALSGPVDAVAVQEVVAAVQRRGWRSVSLTGSLDFQRQAAFQLTMLDPPIAVTKSQLDPQDIAEIEATRASRPAEQVPEPVGIRI